MKLLAISGLLLMVSGMAAAQTVPAGWKILKDEKGLCQIAVPPDWIPNPRSPGVASLKNTQNEVDVNSDTDTTVPLAPSIQKMLHVIKMFENTSQRVFYSFDRGRNSQQFSERVPRPGGTCTMSVTFVPPTTEETAKKIALSLGPAK
jgi:hypothetical protein